MYYFIFIILSLLLSYFLIFVFFLVFFKEKFNNQNHIGSKIIEKVNTKNKKVILYLIAILFIQMLGITMGISIKYIENLDIYNQIELLELEGSYDKKLHKCYEKVALQKNCMKNETLP